MCCAGSLGPSSTPVESQALKYKRCAQEDQEEKNISAECDGSHRAHSADARVHGALPVALLRGLLGEEEVDLVVIPVGVVWDEVGGDEPGVCGGGRTWETRRKQSVL